MEFIADIEDVGLERSNVISFTKIAGREAKMNVYQCRGEWLPPNTLSPGNGREFKDT